MSILDVLERKYGKYAPSNITKILLIGQIVAYILIYAHPEYTSYMYLSGSLLYKGQLWRIITALFAPVAANIFFMFIALYFFYMLGNALESRWGSFRYFAYIAISYGATIIYSLVFPNVIVSNVYLFTTLFLAFAWLFPDFQVLLLFVLPIKVKWLGYLAWAGLLLSFLFGPLSTKILIIFSISNFLVFFSEDLLLGFHLITRGRPGRPKSGLKILQKPNHICALCGKNEINDPNMEIRYCSQCIPTTCYCGAHIRQHQHKRPVN